MVKEDLLYLFLYKRIKGNFKTDKVTLKELKDFLSRDYSVNHLIPKWLHIRLLNELCEKDMLFKSNSLEYKIQDRRDLLKKLIQLQINY